MLARTAHSSSSKATASAALRSWYPLASSSSSSSSPSSSSAPPPPSSSSSYASSSLSSPPSPAYVRTPPRTFRAAAHPIQWSSLHIFSNHSSSARLCRSIHSRSALAGKEYSHVEADGREMDGPIRTYYARPTKEQKNSRSTKFTNTFAPKNPQHEKRVLERIRTGEHPYARKAKPNRKRDRDGSRSAPRSNFVFTGFPVPTKPTLAEIGRHLSEQIKQMCAREDIGRRLIAYGVNGDTAEALFKHVVGSAPKGSQIVVGDSVPDEEYAVHVLVRVWSRRARALIGSITSEHVGSSSASEDLDRSVFPTDLEGIRDSFAIEGEKCLPRACLGAFLDWVEGHARLLTAPESGGKVSASQRQVLTSSLSQLALLRKSTDLRLPTYNYPLARTLTRQIHLHIGPTNSGKTHGALVALSKARTGVFAGPLRLLAHEVWERFNEGTISPGVPPRACNLVTGEEQRTVDPMAGLVSCTVEMVNLQKPWDVAVIDEIQMIGDPQRGYAWTDAVIGLPAKEIHLCGEASTVPLIRRIVEACGDELSIHEYKRLTPLSIAPESLDSDISRTQRGDCIVAFSRSGIFNLKAEIEKRTGLRCAVAYGALPPETKSEQAKLFNEGKLDVMVASDAIGMGLNLKIKRVIFDTLTKWNGQETVALSTSQIKQIAGRAGRYGTKRADNEPDGGIVTTRHADQLDMLKLALEAPVVPINQAAIQPSSDALADLSAILPPISTSSSPSSSAGRGTGTGTGTGSGGLASQFRSLSEIYADVSMLAQIDARSFFLSDFSQQHEISPLVEKASRSLLTIQEREKFSNAPANTRDERVMAFLAMAVRRFSHGGLVKFGECCKGLGMIEVESLALSALSKAKTTRAAEIKAAQTDEEAAFLRAEPLASQLNSTHPLLDVNTLMLLESLHRCLSLYLWLSFRFPLAFCYRLEVEKRKRAVEEAIEFCLEGIRFGRARRLRALGRNADADKTLDKKGWKQEKR